VLHVYDADHWRRLAQEARARAEKITDADARREMRAIASAYDRLADHTAQTAGRRAAQRC
jgi:pyruvate-formate lyase